MRIPTAKGLAGAEHQLAAGPRIRPGGAFYRDAREGAAANLQVRKVAFKANVRAKRGEFLPESAQDHVEIVGAHVGAWRR